MAVGPLMQRFHKPGEEKRSVVVLDDDAWAAWMTADRDEEVRAFLTLFDADTMRAVEDPRAATKRV